MEDLAPTRAIAADRLVLSGFVLDRARGELFTPANELAALRRQALDVLLVLAANAGHVVSKDELMRRVWPGLVVGEDSLVQAIADIRRVLGDREHRLVRTVARRGYLLSVDPAATPAVGARPRGPWWSRRPAVVAAAVLLAATITAMLYWSFGAGSTGLPATARSGDSMPRVSLAVLPLDNLGGDRDQDYFAAALGNDLITDLSRVPQLLVIAGASTAGYAGLKNELPQVGRELGVRYVLQGSVRRLDSALRLNLQLFEAASGRALWAERWDANEGDDGGVAGLQARVSSSLARTLQVRIVEADSQRRQYERPTRPEAHDLALRGWYLWVQNRPDSVARAREAAQQAVAIDPNSAYAWAILNFTYISDLTNNWMALRGHTRDEWLNLADAAAARAYALDPGLPASMGARAAVLMLRGQLEQSIALREKQIALNPSNPVAYHNLAAAKLFSGQPDEVLVHERDAMRVSPRDPKLHQMRGLVALAALHMQRPREALTWAESAVATNPDYAAGYSYIAAAAAQLGDRPRAEAALAEFRRLLPGRSIQALRDERWSDRPGYLAGQEHFLDGLRKAGLPDR